jgi:hypothetical protein
MNDFTKEELEYIFYCVDIVTHKNDESDIYGKLQDKIQSMIDNYCEHEPSRIRYAVIKLRSTDTRDYEYKCEKCKKTLFQY